MFTGIMLAAVFIQETSQKQRNPEGIMANLGIGTKDRTLH
jgi:hypothetical protein